MHTIHIGISGNHHIIKTETFQSFFDIQCMLQQVEFFIFVNNFLGQAKTI